MFGSRYAQKLFLLFACCLLVAAANVVIVVAQKPGDKVEYKAQSWPEKWEVGTFVKTLPGGKQVLIREKPSEYFPDGAEKAYTLDEIRPVKQAPVKEPKTPPKPIDKPRDDPPDRGGDPTGGPEMSQQDILNYLKNKLGNGDPFKNPKREKVLQELRAEILRRGVNFRFQAIGDFANKIGKYGERSDFDAAMMDNFGAPAKRDELYGKWRFSKIGAPNDPMFGNNDSLVINANGTYSWGKVKGNWRKATTDEMDKANKGGEGIVLQKGKSGSDWIAFKRNEEGAATAAQGIMLEILPSHNLRERGTR